MKLPKFFFFFFLIVLSLSLISSQSVKLPDTEISRIYTDNGFELNWENTNIEITLSDKPIQTIFKGSEKVEWIDYFEIGRDFPLFWEADLNKKVDYNINCNDEIYQSENKFYCGKIELDFDDLTKEYFEMENETYIIKPQAYDLTIEPNKKEILDEFGNITYEVKSVKIGIKLKDKYLNEIDETKKLKLGDKRVHDPSYQITNYTNGVLNNVQCEGNDYFCHSGINDSSVVLYMPFDVQEKSDNITYDYSGNHNDGTIYGATYNQSDKSYMFTTASNNSGRTFIKINSLIWTWKSYSQLVSGIWKNFTISNSSTYIDGVLTCPDNMAYINKLGGYCIDKYEASTSGCETVGNNCASAQTNYCTACTPTGSFGTTSGVGTTVNASSKQNVAPLVRVSQLQSIQMCANVGKHLCTSQEWLGASNIKGQLYNLPTDLAVSPYSCVTGSSTRCNYANNSNLACNTSYYVNGLSNCSSAEGVYDMTGNVWEWTNETVNTNKSSLCNPTSTEYCYINSTSMDWQSSSTSPIYGNDGTYFIGNSTTNKAVLRGGYWYYGANAGPFCANLYYGPTDTYSSIGFRCCRS